MGRNNDEKSITVVTKTFTTVFHTSNIYKKKLLMNKIWFLFSLGISLTSAGILAVDNDDFLSRFHYKKPSLNGRRMSTKNIVPAIQQTDSDSRRVRSIDFRDYHSFIEIPEYHGKAVFKSNTDLSAFRKLLASSMKKN